MDVIYMASICLAFVSSRISLQNLGAILERFWDNLRNRHVTLTLLSQCCHRPPPPLDFEHPNFLVFSTFQKAKENC